MTQKTLGRITDAKHFRMRLERRNEPIEESARAIEAGKKKDCWYLTHMTPSQLTLIRQNCHNAEILQGALPVSLSSNRPQVLRTV